MSSYLTDTVIKSLRGRKLWRRVNLLDSESISGITVLRTENGEHMPTQETLSSITKGFGEEMHTYFHPYLEDITFDMMFWCKQISTAMHYGRINEAKKLLAQAVHWEEMKSGLNLQFLTYCRIRIELDEGNVLDSMAYELTGAIKITFPEFQPESFSGTALIFNEANLIYALACIHKALGNYAQALELLKNLRNCLEQSVCDSHISEKLLPEIALSQVQILLSSNSFDAALEDCNAAISVSLKWNKGRELPRLLYNKAFCLMKLKQADTCGKLLLQAHSCCFLLGQYEMAREVIKRAKELFNVDIAPFTPGRDFSFLWNGQNNRASGRVGRCLYLGEVLYNLRRVSGVSQKEIYTGICSSGNYSKIEKGDVHPNFFFLEAFMERLGYDVNDFTDTFLSREDFENKELRREIHAYLSMDKYDVAETLLQRYKKLKGVDAKLHKQFIMSTESTILLIKDGVTDEYISMLDTAIRMTVPNFSIEQVRFQRLTYVEILLINKRANAFGRLGDFDKGLMLFENLKASMDMHYVDEFEKMRTYPMVLYNYSKYLGLAGKYHECLKISDIGQCIAVKHMKLDLLPLFATNNAYCMLELGRHDDAIEHFIMAYHGTKAIEDESNAEIIKAYVQEKLDIDLSV